MLRKPFHDAGVGHTTLLQQTRLLVPEVEEQPNTRRNEQCSRLRSKDLYANESESLEPNHTLANAYPHRTAIPPRVRVIPALVYLLGHRSGILRSESRRRRAAPGRP